MRRTAIFTAERWYHWDSLKKVTTISQRATSRPGDTKLLPCIKRVETTIKDYIYHMQSLMLCSWSVFAILAIWYSYFNKNIIKIINFLILFFAMLFLFKLSIRMMSYASVYLTSNFSTLILIASFIFHRNKVLFHFFSNMLQMIDW